MVDYSGEKESLGSGYIAIFSFLFLLIISEYDTAFEIFGKAISRKGMISIKLYELRNKHYFAEKILPFYELIGDAVFDVMSIYATSLFHEVYYKKHNKNLKNDRTIQRPFLFSDACVSKEIKEHVIGYWYCIDRIDEKTFINSLMFVAKGNNKEKVKKACERIEIYEQDAIAIDDSLAFGYFNGIRNCYMYTKADPYWRTGKIRTKSVTATWKYRKIPTDML